MDEKTYICSYNLIVGIMNHIKTLVVLFTVITFFGLDNSFFVTSEMKRYI